MSRTAITVLFACVTVTLSLIDRAPAQPGEVPATQPATRPVMEFEQYQLVILRRGDNVEQIPKEQAAEIQRQHLAHMGRLAEQGKILIAGPFSDQQDKSMRGMCLYRCASIDEARRLAEEDPAVKAGRLKVDVLTWNVEKGYMTFPKAPKNRSTDH
jgi:uncharacterized protein YciI